MVTHVRASIYVELVHFLSGLSEGTRIGSSGLFYMIYKTLGSTKAHMIFYTKAC